MMTKEEFEARFCSGVKKGVVSFASVEEMHNHGLFAIPCEAGCDYEKCQGWHLGVLELEEGATGKAEEA